MRPVHKTAAYIQEHYSGDGFEVTGTDSEGGCVWVMLPPSTHDFTAVLAELADETGASCDLELTATGATLTVWATDEWPTATAVPPRARTSWTTIAASAAAVIISAIAAVLLTAHTPPPAPVDSAAD